MKKEFLTVILIMVLSCMGIVPVFGAQIEETAVAQEETVGEGELETEAEAESQAVILINPDNYVEVQSIDLSLHAETTGEFSPVYMYDNPFLGKDTSKGVIIEFYVKPTWEVHELATIFSIMGTEDYDGRLYFTPGSYLGFNSELFGGYFDANLYNYTIVNDYIKDGAKIRIELKPEGFAVYSDDMLCYDQTILDNLDASSGDFTSESDFSTILNWLSGAQKLYFGYGSWWNVAGTDAANVNLSDVSFRLMDQTVVFDTLYADKELIESLGGSINLTIDSAGGEIVFEQIDVEVFDISSVKYEGISVLWYVVSAVVIVIFIAVAIILSVIKKRSYDDV